MRDIKFRAWDVLTNTMRDWNDLQQRGFAIFKNQYLMQYTGLKDKNGKEIYEGDILHTPGGTFESNQGNEVHKEVTDVVEYSEEHAAYRGVRHQVWMCHTEVIGNIYENPELLK